MTPDVRGAWVGTWETGTSPGYNVYDGSYGGRREILEIDGPRTIRDVELIITSQDAFKRTAVKSLVSVISGQLKEAGDGFDLPVAGFVDDAGVTRLGMYESGSYGDLTFTGQIARRGLLHQLRGPMMARRTETGPRPLYRISYTFGTLIVSKLLLSAAGERTYVVKNHYRVF